MSVLINPFVFASVAGNKTIAAGAGSYALTGSSAGLIINTTLVAGSGSYALTGSSADLINSTAFEFSDLASLRFWFKADDLAGAADNDPIVQFTDSSGTGNHATQATSGLRAIVDAVGTLNGFNVAEFVSATPNWYQWGNVFSGFSETCLMYVCKMKADPPGAAGDGGAWTQIGSVGASESYLPFTDGNIYDGFASTARPNMGNPSTSLSSQFNIISHHSKTPNAALWINGNDGVTPFYTDSSTTTFFTSTPYLGRQKSGSPFVNGYLAEMVIFNSFLTTSDRQKCEGRLAHKYGLTANLDAGHPYKSTPP